MAQPYDLSGFVGAQDTVDQMVADQAAGRTKFAGGAESWIENPPGTFLAVLSGGALVPTTTNAVRATLRTLQVTFDLIAAAPGAVAENSVVKNSAAVPPPALEAGCAGANGPLVYAGTPQATNYDLSGIAALQATATAMMADQQSGATSFAGGFTAILVPGGSPTTTTMAATRRRLARLRAAFDLLAQ